MECNNPLLLFLLSLISLTSTAAAANITGIYAFGDSILDPGNNNHLPTICRSDHKPYGIRFPNGIASGRFSDGLLPGDILVSEMGIKKLLPAYKDSSVTEEELASGVSFASSCSGLDDLTAKDLGVLTMSTQFEFFEMAFEKMQKKIGIERAVEAVENALFLIAAGTNDMMFNYYPLPVRRLMYSLSEYHDLLLENLETLIKNLHSRRGRMVGVMGMPPLGCLPLEVTAAKGIEGKRECIGEHNADAQSYNMKLQGLITRLRRQLPNSKIVYADVYGPLMEMMNSPEKFGLEHTLEGCCGSGVVELGPLCGKLAPTCSDPSQYLFWDAAHPTQAVYNILTKRKLDQLRMHIYCVDFVTQVGSYAIKVITNFENNIGLI